MKIIFEGVVGRRFGREHILSVNTPNDAIRALCHKLPGFRAYMEGSHEFGIYWKVLTNRDRSGIDYAELNFNCQELVLVPVITGKAGFGNILKVIVGVFLVAFALTSGFGLLTWGAAGTISAGIQTAMVSLGFGLIFTGVAGLLSPGVPQKDDKNEGKGVDDAIFDGAADTTSQGTPVPLVYGEFLCQSIPTISSYIKDNTGYYLGVISEGKIEGLAGPPGENIFLNGAKLQATPVDRLQLTDGTQTTRAIDFVDSAGFHLSAGSTLTVPENNSSPNKQVIRSFVQPEADTLQLRLSYGPCYCLHSYSGESSSVSYHVPYTTAGTSFFKLNYLQYQVDVIDGAGSTVFSQTFSWGDASAIKSVKLQLINVDISGRPVPISCRVTRLDRGEAPDPESKKSKTESRNWQWVKGDVTFISADITWSEKLYYPQVALLGIKFGVAEFTSMPSIQAKIKGIHVPIVSSSLKISYAWSNNPAYVLLDLLTHPRYGVGGRTFIKTTTDQSKVTQPGIRMEDVDLGSFSAAAKYCEDNKITFNGVIDNTADALGVLQGVASSFHAQIFYAGGKIGLVIDKPVADPSEYRLFSEANVIQEQDDNGEVKAPCFTYEGVAKAARRTIANVSWINPANFYTESKVAIHHPEAIARYGYRPVDVRAIGCTTEAQAIMLGRYTIGSNIYNTETVTFSVAGEGVLLLPGDIVIIADGNKTPGTYGGRVKSASTTKVVIDRDLPSGIYTGYALYVYGNTGVCMRSIISGVSSRTLDVSTAYSSTPTTLHSWVLVDESKTKSFRRYRVQEISEDPNGTYQIIGIKYDEQKFEFMKDDRNGVLENIGTKLFSSQGTPALNPAGINFGLLVNP